MRFVPHETVTLHSPFHPDELASRLARMVDEPRIVRWPWDPSTKVFEGHLDNRRFTIWRLLKFQRNSFLPRIVGRIEAGEGGSTVRIVMRLHRVVAAFMAVWIGGALVGCVSPIASALARGRVGGELVVAAVFPLLGYLVCTVPFRLEVRRALRLLAPLGERARRPDERRLVRE